MFGIVFLALAVPGFAARGRGGHFVDAIEAGAIAGAITFALFLLFGILRVNLFLDMIRDRSDWENLVADFGRSGFQSSARTETTFTRKGSSSSRSSASSAQPISGSLGGLLASVVRPSSSKRSSQSQSTGPFAGAPVYA